MYIVTEGSEPVFFTRFFKWDSNKFAVSRSDNNCILKKVVAGNTQVCDELDVILLYGFRWMETHSKENLLWLKMEENLDWKLVISFSLDYVYIIEPPCLFPISFKHPISEHKNNVLFFSIAKKLFQLYYNLFCFHNPNVVISENSEKNRSWVSKVLLRS